MSPELAGAVTNGALKAQDEYRHSQRLVLNAIMALHERLRPEAPADEDHSQFRSDRGSNADPVVPADDELLGDSAEFRAAASRARSMPRLLTFQPGQRIKLHHGRHPAVVKGYRLTNPDGPINIPEYDRLRGDCYRWGEKMVPGDRKCAHEAGLDRCYGLLQQAGILTADEIYGADIADAMTRAPR